MKEISIEQLNSLNEGDKKKEPTGQEKELGDIFGSVDKMINRVKDEVVQFHEKKEEEEFEEKLNEEIKEEKTVDEYSLEDTDIIVKNEPTQEPKKIIIAKSEEKVESTKEDLEISNESKSSMSLLDIDPEDLNSLDENEEESNKEQMSKLKTSIKSKIKPITNVIDLNSFTISKKPVSVTNALNIANELCDRTIDWVLPATGRSISMKEFKAYDIEKLIPNRRDRNMFNTYKDIYKLIHQHVVDNNKPNLESFVKSIKFSDLNHLYFTIFKAAFDKSNAVPYNCTKCNEVFLHDIDIENMIKYKNEEIKKEVLKLLNQDTTTESTEYNVELLQVSDAYVIGFKEPSIYDVVFENAVLDEEFRTKYANLLEILTYIDSIYLIDFATNQLLPIELKVYPNNVVKTIKNKVLKYSEILKTLNSDQFHNVNSILDGIKDRHDYIDYILPEVTCPKCGHLIPEVVQSAEALLFTRHRLMGVANMSID